MITNNTNNSQPFGIFVTNNDSIYTTDWANNWVEVWSHESIISTKIISGNLTQPYSVFVTITDDLFVDNGINNRIEKWELNATNSVLVTNVSGPCFSLFIDVNNNLYCTIQLQHVVVKKPLNSSIDVWSIAAGNKSAGPETNMLRNPGEIFVDVNLDLYVADYGNRRIQRFRLGQQHGTTIEVKGATENITLSGGFGIVLDADNNLFITDFYNHRIIGSGPDGFRCLVGCSGISGSEPNQLYMPMTMNFDSYGNMFVVDLNNNRIQKFVLATNSCGKHPNL